MSASWDEDSLEIAIRDVVKDDLVQSSSEKAFKKNIATEKRKNDSLKRFEIHDGNNITIVRAKDLADAIKKVTK